MGQEHERRQALNLAQLRVHLQDAEHKVQPWLGPIAQNHCNVTAAILHQSETETPGRLKEQFRVQHSKA